MKKFLCLILCAVLTAGAAVTANAKTVKPHKGVDIYNSAKTSATTRFWFLRTIFRPIIQTEYYLREAILKKLLNEICRLYRR